VATRTIIPPVERRRTEESSSSSSCPQIGAPAPARGPRRSTAGISVRFNRPAPRPRGLRRLPLRRWARRRRAPRR
jgi:hypothetical protein